MNIAQIENRSKLALDGIKEQSLASNGIATNELVEMRKIIDTHPSKSNRFGVYSLLFFMVGGVTGFTACLILM